MTLAKNIQMALDLTRAGDLAGATRAIRAGLAGSKDSAAQSPDDSGTIELDPGQWAEAPNPGPATSNPETSGKTQRVVRPLHEVLDALGRLKQRVFEPGVPLGRSNQRAPKVPAGARFETRSDFSSEGQRSFKLYIPSRPLAEPRSLLIMLHGCTQNPDDFAAGTQMNELAEENRFLVAYPAQPKSANPTACWNWFNPQNQIRDGGEAAVIVAQARSLMAEFEIDPRKVFVAGLSAGGAMAANLAALYPDVFSGVGIHSGLPFQSATDVVSALTAMRGQAPPVRRQDRDGKLVPTIVFHGSADRTVHPSNGAKIIDAHLGDREVHKGSVAAGNGRAFRRMITRAPDGMIRAEHWMIEGGGHAWSGGSPDGSFADALGPNASREMVRFFLKQGAGANRS